MDSRKPTTRSCPKCGSGEYPFRSRKKIVSEPGQGEGEAVETKYRRRLTDGSGKDRS
jgi:hypothetical protein